MKNRSGSKVQLHFRNFEMFAESAFGEIGQSAVTTPRYKNTQLNALLRRLSLVSEAYAGSTEKRGSRPVCEAA